MIDRLRFRTVLPRQVAASMFILVLAGCESDRGSPAGRTAPEATAASRAPIPEMEAAGMFFSGQIEAEVLLAKGGFSPRDAAKSGDNGATTAGRGGFGGGGGGRRGGGGSRGGGGGGGGGDAGTSRGAARQSEDATPLSNIRASNEPPVKLQLRLTNRGAESVEVEVSDFNSDLGNFVVQPRKITLPANGSVEAEPMTSRLGVKASEIALTVTIRTNGRTEKQVLALRTKAATAPPPSTDAPLPSSP